MTPLRTLLLFTLLSFPAAASADVTPVDAETEADGDGCSVGAAGSFGAAAPVLLATGLLFVRRRRAA